MKTVYVVLGVLILIAIGIWMYFNPRSVSKSSSDIGTAAQASDVARTAIPDAVGKTNPFQTDVNPVNGYKNPFGN